MRHACPFLDSLGKEKQLRRSSKVGFRESKNRHVWQDHFWARGYKRLASLFRDLISIAARFKLFSKPFANHLLFQSTRYLEQFRAVFLNCCLQCTMHQPIAYRRINACGSADYSATWHRNRIDIGGLKMDSWRASVFATCVPIFGLAW